MAEIVIGDVVAKLTLDASRFEAGIRSALAALNQFQQVLSQLTPSINQFGQAFQQATAQANQQMQTLAQRTQQVHQSFQQFNTTINQTHQQFNTVNISIQNFNTQLNQTNTNLNQARQAAQNFGSSWQSVLQIAAGIGLATTIQGIVHSFTGFITESVQLAGRMQDLARSFAAVEGSTGQASRTLANLFSIAQSAGVSFGTVAEGFRRLEAGAQGTTLSHQDLLRAFEDITKGSRVMGLSTQQITSALVAFEQILTKGRLSAEELVRQLGNAVPGGLEKTARALGITTAELRSMAEAGVIPGTVAFTAFATEMGRIGSGGGPIEGFSASIARLGNEFTSWKTAIGETINTSLVPLLNVLTSISKIARELADIRAPGGGKEGENILPDWLRGLLNLKGLFVPGELNKGEQNVLGQVPGGQPFAPSQYTNQIQAAAASARLDPGLLSQLVRVESRFNPVAESSAGALGLGQLLPSTAQQLQPGITREQLLDPQKNLELAARYLAQQMEHFKQFDDQVKLALAAYHSGPGTIDRLLEEAQRRGLPQTFEGITHIPPSAGGLGPAGRAYPGQVLEAVTTPTTQGPSADVSRITQQYVKDLGQANEQFDRLRARSEALAASTANYGGILNKDIAQQLQQIVDKYVQIQTYVAAFPQQAQAFGAGIKQEIEERTREAAILQQSLLTEAGRRDLLKSQVEQLEQLAIRQRAQLVTRTQGPEEAERFARAATAALQQQRLEDRPRLAGLTLQQQIADYGARLAALQNQANALGAQIEEERVRAQRPALEATLTRITSLMGRPDRSAPEQAAEQVRQQFEQARKQLIVSIQELARHPALQDLQEKFQNALQGLGTAADEQAQIMYERTDTQMRERITQIGDQIDQIRLRIGAAGLDPLATDLERIQREFAAMNAQLLRQQQILSELAKTATPDTQIAIAGQQDRIKAALGGVQPGLDAALLERRTRDERAYIEQATQQLQQLQLVQGPETLFGPTRLDVQLQQRTRTKTGESIFQGPEGEQYAAQARQLQEQIRAQERLNYLAGLFEQFGNSVGQAWTQALFSIADGTKTVADAFRDMARSILQSLAQIAAQEGFKALIRLGVGVIAGAATGGISGGYEPGASATDIAYATPGGGGGFGSGADLATVFAQSGAVIRRPTMVLAGESAQSNPEYILNRGHMQELLSSAMRAAPNAGGQALGQGVTVINVASKEVAQQAKAQEEALGKQVVINYVLEELAAGDGSRINRTIRSLQR